MDSVRNGLGRFGVRQTGIRRIASGQGYYPAIELFFMGTHHARRGICGGLVRCGAIPAWSEFGD